MRKSPPNVLRLIGKKFGKLKVIKFAYSKNWRTYWLCQCECGKQKIIIGKNLQNGLVKSCGCYRDSFKKIHGMTTHKTKDNFYSIWQSIKSRCNGNNKLSKIYYKSRGIKVCLRWQTFENFRDDMYKSYLEHKKNNDYTSIDRIDNDGNYEPNNCHWATRKEQMNNTRLVNKIKAEDEYTIDDQLWEESKLGII